MSRNRTHLGRNAGVAILFLASLGLAWTAPSQGSALPPPCTAAEKNDIRLSAEAPFLVAMALCKTVECLRAFLPAAMAARGTARLVYYARQFALKPQDPTVAGELLATLPPFGGSYSRVTYLGVALWPGESSEQMIAGERVGDSLSEEAATAAILRPDRLPDFLRYSLAAVSNPHDDIGRATVRVCKHDHTRFIGAVSTLSIRDRRALEQYVIRVQDCKQVAVSEAN